MQKVEFPPNTSIPIFLKYREGKVVEGRFGDQMYYTLTDGRCMYLDMDVAAKINLLEPGKGEMFMMCKRWSGKKGETPQWDVWRPGPGQAPPAVPPAVPAAETPLEADLRRSLDQQRAGTAVSPAAPVQAPPAPVAPAQPVSNSNGNKPNGAAGNGHAAAWAAAPLPEERPKTKLDDALKTVLSAVFSATQYAKEIGYQMPPFTSEDIRTMANTLMIQNGNGGRHVA
jgi:hypothetical protein